VNDNYFPLPADLCGYAGDEDKIICGKPVAFVFKLKSWPDHHRGSTCYEHGTLAATKSDLEWIRSA